MIIKCITSFCCLETSQSGRARHRSSTRFIFLRPYPTSWGPIGWKEAVHPINMISTTSIRLGTLNVRSLVSDSKKEELAEAMKCKPYDVIGISETRLKGNGTCDLGDSGYNMHFAGSDRTNFSGTGFLIAKELERKFNISFRGCTERISLLEIKNDRRTLRLIQVYLPTTAH